MVIWYLCPSNPSCANGWIIILIAGLPPLFPRVDLSRTTTDAISTPNQHRFMLLVVIIKVPRDPPTHSFNVPKGSTSKVMSAVIAQL